MHKMIAEFIDESYDDYKSGNAICNNGFRSAKGNFHPKQPSFRELTEQEEKALNSTGESNILCTQECATTLDNSSSELEDKIIEAVADVAVVLTEAFVIEFVFPAAKKFISDKIVPTAERMWDSVLEKLGEKKKQQAKKQQKQLGKQKNDEIPVQDTTSVQKPVEQPIVVNIEEYRKTA